MVRWNIAWLVILVLGCTSCQRTYASNTERESRLPTVTVAPMPFVPTQTFTPVMISTPRPPTLVARATPRPVKPTAPIALPVSTVIATPQHPDDFPTPPAQMEDYPAILEAFLNQSPQRESQLNRLLAYWDTFDSSVPNVALRHSGGPRLVGHNLDADLDLEYIVIIDGRLTEPFASLVIVLNRERGATYTATTYPLQTQGATPGGSHVLAIRDINQTPAPELLIVSYSSGACTSFTTITLLNWRPPAFTVLLDATLNDAEVQFEEVGVTKIEDVILFGGGSSCYAPMGRRQLERYQWNGRAYAHISTRVDPTTENQLYFLFLDGNDAADRNDDQKAIRLYRKALAQPRAAVDSKTAWVRGEQEQELRALIRMRLIASLIRLDEHVAARQQVTQGIVEDGTYGAWYQHFWEAYTDKQELRLACQAVIAFMTQDLGEDWWFPGYTVAESHYDITIACPANAQ
jgi:hypothetical protein